MEALTPGLRGLRGLRRSSGNSAGTPVGFVTFIGATLLVFELRSERPGPGGALRAQAMQRQRVAIILVDHLSATDFGLHFSLATR